MQILIVTFQLDGIDEADYERMTVAIAPAIAQTPGLLGKAFLADSETNTYGGVYLFESRQAIARYLDSEVTRAVQANPQFVNFSARAFDTIEAATRVTQGRLPLYPVSLAA